MLGLCREPEAIIQANLVYQLAHKYRRPGHRLYLGARLAEKSGFPDRKEQTVTIWLDLSLNSVPDAAFKYRGTKGEKVFLRLVNHRNRPSFFR